MSSRRLAKISLAAAIAMMVVSVGGFIVALVLNAFFLDKYNAYGEVPVPGSGSLYLPAGEVTVSLHTVVIGGPDGGGLPVPPLGVTIAPPDGVAQPVVTENIGSTTTVNNDAHVRVWVAQIPPTAPTTSRPTARSTDSSIRDWPSGTRVRTGFLVWLFVGMFVVGWSVRSLSGWCAAGAPAARRRRRLRLPVYAGRVSLDGDQHGRASPSDEGVRLERLKTLAALRDSGALTEAEFETEKRRILEAASRLAQWPRATHSS